MWTVPLRPAFAGGPLDTTSLADLEPVSVRQAWGQMEIDRSVQGKRLQIGNRTFAHGIGTHANSEIVYALDSSYERFEAWVGVDAEMASFGKSSVVFRVLADGKTVFDSGVMRVDTPARRVIVQLKGVSTLTLVAADGGDGINGDHADWAEPVLIGVKRVVPAPVGRYTVRAPGIVLSLSEHGEIAGLTLGAKRMRYPLQGETRMAGCRTDGPVSVERIPGGGMRFSRALVNARGERCTLVERFTPTADSVRWEILIRGKGAPWTAAIATDLLWPATPQSRFWAAWSNPDSRDSGWQDPMIPARFAGRRLGYGAGGGVFGGAGSFIGIPLATVLEPGRDIGLTLALSPEDPLLGLTLSTRSAGRVAFTRTNYRISKQAMLRFAIDLVPHEADPRGALRWMVHRYPRYFNPPNPAASSIAGCGAYSSFEGPLDTAKMKRMAFGVNWKASFDFPYMGMFLPPVPGETDTWPRFDADSGGSAIPGRQTMTSRKQMNDYSRRMRADGFHVLNYFNVTEFGAQVHGPEQAVDRPNSEVWRNATDFLYMRVADGVLPGPNGKPYPTWGGAVVMDPGGPNYRRFLLEQAQRHVDTLPDSSGICIDRMDWLGFYNPRGDDGISWIDGKPSRSLLMSWKGLLHELGPMMHAAGKAIFVNPHLVRLEMLRQVDGIYCEFGDNPAYLNATALAGLRRPVLEWTGSDAEVRRNPDAFFQRHLHLGIFPTAPFPGNDHTLLPGDWVDKRYEEYGPLLNLLRGKKWVLSPRPVAVAGDAAKVNIFEIPGGYAVPVTFGGKAKSVRLTIRVLPGMSSKSVFTVVHPGGSRSLALRPHRGRSQVEMDVPLVRGCAMVHVADRQIGAHPAVRQSLVAAPSRAFVWKSEAPRDCPFPQSKSLTGIYFTGRHSDYYCGDTWYPSWASDGNLYSPWTDGSTVGVGCSSDGGAVTHTGNGLLIGDDPLSLTVRNTSPPQAAGALPYQGRYPCGSLVHNGVWYYGTYCLGPAGSVEHEGFTYNWPVLGPMPGFRISTDGGKTWTASPLSPDRPLFPEPSKPMGPVKMGAPHFVDFGKNMVHSPDGMAYLVGMGAEENDPKPRFANLSWISADQLYLARVRPSVLNINDVRKYEFFAGNDAAGRPVWTHDFARIRPLLSWNNNMGCATVTYDPPLKKYLMCVTDGWPTCAKMNSYILEADRITGPWRLVTYMKAFGEQGYFLNFPSKFLSRDGRTLWLCYSTNFSPGWNGVKLQAIPPGGHYGLCLTECRLLSPGEKPAIPPDPLASAHNIAPDAAVEASSTHEGYSPRGAVDRRVGGFSSGSEEEEWASRAEGSGAWIKLRWNRPQTVSSISLYDRPNSLDQVTAGMIEMSDGTAIPLERPLPDSAARGLEVAFPARTVSWVRFTATRVKPDSPNIGLSEIAVFGHVRTEADVIPLDGEWRCRLDPDRVGEKESWAGSRLTQAIHLPGSTDEAGLGVKNTKTPTLDGLYRPFSFTGPVWYQREVTVPSSWRGRRARLFIERAHWETRAFVDGRPVGTPLDSLVAPHEHDLGTLAPGRHLLTIRADNTPKFDLGFFVSILYEGTQTNWNGLIGRLEIRALPAASLDDVQVYPNVERKSARVRIAIENPSTNPVKGALVLAVTGPAGSEPVHSRSQAFTAAPGRSVVATEFPMGRRPRLWDEFSPAMYDLRVGLTARAVGLPIRAQRLVRFGMRRLAVRGTQFAMNGRTLSLRGTLECGIFPRTGYPPADVASWRRICRIAKSYGLNFLRFHSWCPPDAAFAAADEEGVMLQAEGPQANVDVGKVPARDAYVEQELLRMVRAYGNHPSFCLMTPGNEFGGTDSILSGWIERLKREDPRHLYSSPSCGQTTCNREFTEGMPRGIHGPATDADFRRAVAKEGCPLMGHEIGQWTFYPRLEEASKYTGVLQARNFELVRRDLAAKQMSDLAPRFFEATGRHALLLYKEEIEVLLRTPGHAGFSLLDLHDYPGQGTALIGLLDPFWDSKGLIAPEEHRRYCGPTVPLLRMPKRTYSAGETFNATAEVSHFGPRDIPQARPVWSLRDARGRVVASGAMAPRNVPTGRLTQLGEIQASLAGIEAPARVTVTVELAGTPFRNAWNIWVYPDEKNVLPPGGVTVCRSWEEARPALDEGRRVLLLPLRIDSRSSLPGRFLPVFWSPIWFPDQKPNTMGILCDPRHPALAGFPTEAHSDWQWHDLLQTSRAVILDDAPPSFRPIVQVIDNFQRNHRLGCLFEARVGAGSLLVCTMDLPAISEKQPAARQMLRSLYAYAASPVFDPEAKLSTDLLERLLTPSANPAMARLGARIVRVDSEAAGYEAAGLLDGDPSTIWHTPWGEQAAPYPHEVVIAFDRPISARGLVCLPRQDMHNGLIKDYVILVSNDGQVWREAARGALDESDREKRIDFTKLETFGYVKFVALSGHRKDEPFAAMAELTVLEAPAPKP